MITRKTYTFQGNSISALVAGNEQDPLALFLHGIPASAELWRAVLPEISQQGWYCIAPDCPGYGDTKVQTDTFYTLEGTANLFIHWIEQEGWNNIWLIGHDIGGGIAQLMLTQKEDLFKKATLSNCATARSWPVPIVQLMQLTARLGLFPLSAKTGVVGLIGGRSLNNTFFNRDKLTNELKQRVFFDQKFSTIEGRQKFTKLLLHLSSDSTMQNMEQLEKVRVPVHLVWAMNDPFQTWGNSGQILEETLKEVKVTQLKNASHFLQLDVPDQYIRAILEEN